MKATTALEHQWPFLLSFLPSEDALESSAFEHGAIRRRRGITSASDLLRLALVYACCGLSLRQTAAWAEAAGVASVSDVALLKRLRSASRWLGNVLGEKLAERAQTSAAVCTALHLRIVDATTVSQPGSTGTDWRLHLGFDLSRFAIDHLELTTVKGGETLKRFSVSRGEVLVGDRGYCHCKGMSSVLARGGDFLIRMNWQNVPLKHPDGEPFDLFPALRSIEEGEVGDFPVLVAPEGKGKIPPFPARLIAVRKSEPAAEAARRKALRERSRKCRTPDPRTLEGAGYVLVLTSLPASRLAAKDALEIYRLRWQIELVFKRMKSILDLGELPAKDPRLVQTYIYAKLIAALLLEELTESYLSFSPWGFKLNRSPPLSLENPARTC
jgi:hypothetical protein